MKGDVISIVEAAYAELDLEDWLASLARTGRPIFDAGYGTHTHVFYVDYESDTVALEHFTSSSTRSSSARAHHLRRTVLDKWPVVGGAQRTPLARAYPRAPWSGLLSQRLGVTRPLLGVVDASGGSGTDAFGVLAADPSGCGVCLCGTLDGSRLPSAATRRLWTKVAVHIAAGFRMVRARDASVEAVLRADGRVEHAEGSATARDARGSLQDAAKAMDRARGRLRRARPEEAIELWRGLVDGQWSLVDHVDSDGKRLLFAKRNTPDVRPWHTLTDRERQVLAYAAEGHAHKLIGYELGISESTSARHIKTAASKVGARSRLDLIRTYRAARARGASLSRTPA